ncbi:MAG: hypothetical protein U0230_16965 [Polyangiales bacterium]
MPRRSSSTADSLPRRAASMAVGCLVFAASACSAPADRVDLALAGDASVASVPAACVPDAHGRAWTEARATAAGPYAVETVDLSLVDVTRATPPHHRFTGSDVRELPTRVWYPRVPSLLRARTGSFPVVMYSHGFSSTREENPELAKHLASHGFVVVAPTFPASNMLAPGGPNAADVPRQPGDVSFVLDRVLELGRTRGHALHGLLDASRIAAVGLSLGGLTTLLVTYHATLRDPRIDVAVAMAPVAGLFTSRFYETTRAPILVLHGDGDAILPYDPHATTFRSQALAPAQLLTLARGTHTGFTTQAKLVTLIAPKNVDNVGCAVVGSALDSDPTDFSATVTALGGAALGVVDPPAADFCPAGLPEGMDPVRQLSIEDAAVLAFLVAHFDGDATTRDRACDFVSRVLPEDPDVDSFRR